MNTPIGVNQSHIDSFFTFSHKSIFPLEDAITISSIDEVTHAKTIDRTINRFAANAVEASGIATSRRPEAIKTKTPVTLRYKVRIA